ncbi:MAG: ectonucleotide pyrophosphatase/phosphodiesterase [Pseudomonadota bacterium]
MPRHPFIARSLRLAVLVLSLLLAACAGAPQTRRTPPAAVILVSIDGLPANAVGLGAMPTLDALAANGVRAEWMNPSYPTLTFPNHYTLVTGLRPDRHGIVHNNMTDPALGVFVSKEAGGRDGRWWGGEPIWATLQKQGGIAATMFWPGSEAEIAGQRPRHVRRFDRSVTADARADQILRWLDLPEAERPRLLTLYFEFLDVAAHEYGVDSPESLQAMRGIDAALARLLAGLRARGLDGRVDLIVVSDHGMADVPKSNVRLLDDRLDPTHYRVDWWGEVVGLTPAPGRADAVEAAFLGRQDHYTCWRKAELPAVWHYGTHPRIPPIVCQAETGWRVQSNLQEPQRQPVKGQHGFDPQDPTMRAVFVAQGPSFRRGATIPALDNVDLYPLLARLLRVEPAANEGDPSATQAALR